jgi:ketosteroid isomerase-like protein
MRRILVIALLATAVPSLLTAQQDRTTGAPEAEIEGIMDQVRQAQLRGDTAALDRLLADDYTFTNPFGEVMDKSQALSEHESGKLRFQSMDVNDVNIRVYGDAAVATGEVTLRGQRGGQDISGRYQATWTLVKDEARWLAVAAQSTRIAPAPGEPAPVED